MKFLWCTIATKDLDASITFYEEVVGLSLQSRSAAGPGVEIAFLGDGETKIELLCNQAETPPNIGIGIALGFSVASVDGSMKELSEKGVKIHSGPFSPNPSVKFFYVEDPSGVRIQFVESV